MKIYKDIKEHISAGDLEIAVDKLKSIEGLHPSVEKEIIVMLSRFNRNKKEYELGILDPDIYDRRNNMTTMCFISIIQKIENIDEMESEKNKSYEEGVAELTWKHYSMAIEKFNSVEKNDENYLKALLNKGIAEYANSISENDLKKVLKYFLEIEVAIIRSNNPNIDLLKKMLFNRITIFKNLNFNKLALNDIEKLKIIDPSWAEYFLSSSINA